jgi:hypothetical protein
MRNGVKGGLCSRCPGGPFSPQSYPGNCIWPQTDWTVDRGKIPSFLSALAPLRRIIATLTRSRYQKVMAIGGWEWQISKARLQDPRRRASLWDLSQRFRAAGCSPSGDGVMPPLSQMQVYMSGFLWHINTPGERTWCAQPLSLAWRGNDVPFGQVWYSVFGCLETWSIKIRPWWNMERNEDQGSSD